MSPLETVRSIYAAFGRNDVDAIVAHLAPDVSWEYAYPDRGVPWLAPRRGRDRARQFFEALAAIEFHRFELRALLGEERLVVALFDVEFTVRRTGRRVTEIDEVHVWRFDENGEVARFRHAVDTLQHLEATRA